jgi:hypothetical protein
MPSFFDVVLLFPRYRGIRALTATILSTKTTFVMYIATSYLKKKIAPAGKA